MLKKILNWPRQAVHRTYAWMMRWAETKQAERALAAFAFMESSFFPIPPDPLLIGTVTARPKHWKHLALNCTIFSVLGGAFGYLIGYGLYETLGKWVIDTYGLHDEFKLIGHKYQDAAFLTVFTAAFTPIPYKLITIAAGVFQINFLTLIIASLLGRGARFFGVAYLTHHLGIRYKDKVAKYIDLFSLAFIGLLVLGFLAVKYVL